MPKVSVIVPVYKVEQYLRRCIDSILAQTFADFELILVDDGSPDSSGVICDEYAAKDSRICVIHKENGGVSSARNAGLDVAVGEFVAFCDSDDWVECQWLSVMHDSIVKTNADVVVSRFAINSELDEETEGKKNHVGTTTYQELGAKFDFLVKIASHQFGWEVWTRLFRNRIIQEHHIRFCETCQNYAEDLAFVLEYTLCSNSQSSIAYSGYHYFLRESSMMRSSQNMIKLDQLNQVSLFVWKRFQQVFEQPKYVGRYAVLHFLLLWVELQKMVGTERYPYLRGEISKIQNQLWFYTNLRKIYWQYPAIKGFFGKKAAQQIILLAHYCMHNNWKRFRYESAVAYKFFIRG